MKPGAQRGGADKFVTVEVWSKNHPVVAQDSAHWVYDATQRPADFMLMIVRMSIARPR